MPNRIFPNVEPTPDTTPDTTPDPAQPYEPPQPDGVTAALALIVGRVAYRIVSDRHANGYTCDMQARTITCPGLVWLSDMAEMADELLARQAGEEWKDAA